MKSVILHTSSQLGPREAVTYISLFPIYVRLAFQDIKSLLLLPSRYLQIALIYLRECFPLAVRAFVWPLRQSAGETAAAEPRLACGLEVAGPKARVVLMGWWVSSFPLQFVHSVCGVCTAMVSFYSRWKKESAIPIYSLQWGRREGETVWISDEALWESMT